MKRTRTHAQHPTQESPTNLADALILVGEYKSALDELRKKHEEVVEKYIRLERGFRSPTSERKDVVNQQLNSAWRWWGYRWHPRRPSLCRYGRMRSWNSLGNVLGGETNRSLTARVQMKEESLKKNMGADQGRGFCAPLNSKNPSNIGNIAQGLSEPRGPKSAGIGPRSYFFTNSMKVFT